MWDQIRDITGVESGQAPFLGTKGQVMTAKGRTMNTRNTRQELSTTPGAPRDEQGAQSALSRRTLLRRAGLTAGAAMALAAGLAADGGLAPLSAFADGGGTGVGSDEGRRGSGAKPNVVLVHGAWADGSSWDEVSALLLREGYPVTAAAIPLSGLADDVARVQSVLAQQTGPTILAGHSIGGAVISGAGANQPNVKALVYVSAFAPDQGETVGQLVGGSGFSPEPGTAVGTSLFVDTQGYAYLHRDAYLRYFAPDVYPPLAQIKAAAQRPLAGSYLGDVAGPAAWRMLPSWFLISTNDLMINPDLQRFEATRMRARVLQVASSHASPLSHPLQVFQLISQAAKVAATA